MIPPGNLIKFVCVVPNYWTGTNMLIVIMCSPLIRAGPKALGSDFSSILGCYLIVSKFFYSQVYLYKL